MAVAAADHQEVDDDDDQTMVSVSGPNSSNNEATVKALYKALASRETGKVAGFIGSDLEWWFHGPQGSHHMMKMLTGKSSMMTKASAFTFNPRSMDASDDYVIVEGREGVQAYWVHFWTLNKEGLIIQFREYFNTRLTVADFADQAPGCSSSSSNKFRHSQPRDLAKRSLPALMLAI